MRGPARRQERAGGPRDPPPVQSSTPSQKVLPPHPPPRSQLRAPRGAVGGASGSYLRLLPRTWGGSQGGPPPLIGGEPLGNTAPGPRVLSRALGGAEHLPKNQTLTSTDLPLVPPGGAQRRGRAAPLRTPIPRGHHPAPGPGAERWGWPSAAGRAGAGQGGRGLLLSSSREILGVNPAAGAVPRGAGAPGSYSRLCVGESCLETGAAAAGSAPRGHARRCLLPQFPSWLPRGPAG